MKRIMLALVFAVLAFATSQVSAKAATIDLGDVTDSSNASFGGALGFFLPPTVISDDIKFTVTNPSFVSGTINNIDISFGPFTLLGINGFTATFLGNPLTLAPDGSFSIAGILAAGDYLIHIAGTTSGFFGGAYFAEVAAATAPIPGALLLFVTAIGGMGFIGLRRRRSTEV
ncbi:hypothetical protein [Dongia sp. agr-C8]